MGKANEKVQSVVFGSCPTKDSKSTYHVGFTKFVCEFKKYRNSTNDVDTTRFDSEFERTCAKDSKKDCRRWSAVRPSPVIWESNMRGKLVITH